MSLETASAFRAPPSDIAAERAVIGGVLISPAVLDDLAELAVDDFFLPGHRDIVETMRSLAARGRRLDPIVIADDLKTRGVLDRLDGGEGYLLTCANECGSLGAVSHYARIIAEKAALRRVIAAAAEIQANAYGDLGGSDVEHFLDEARAKLSGVELHGANEPVRIGTIVDSVIDEIEQTGQQPERFFVRTGLHALDEKIIGFGRENLVVIASNPGKGKTALVEGIASYNAQRGVPALIFSLEMSMRELTKREIAKEARVNGKIIQRGSLSSSQWGRVEAATPRIKSETLWIDDEARGSKQICSKARRWWARQRLAMRVDGGAFDPIGLVGIDYLGLVVSDDMDARTREREVALMSRRFKGLAKELKIPIVLICQLNRDNTKVQDEPREPRLSDLKDSGAIEADADVAIFTWWRGTPAETGAHDAELLVRKHRNGVCGTAAVSWWPEFTMFTDRDSYDYSAQREMPV